MSSQRRAEFVRRRIELLREEQEAWKGDHDRAMACFELDELIKDSAQVYEDICRLDEQWHLLIYKTGGDHPTDTIDDLYESWFAATRRLNDLFSMMEAEYAARGFDRKNHTWFVACRNTCAAILDPSELESDLADEAIQQHRNGDTIELEV